MGIVEGSGIRRGFSLRVERDVILRRLSMRPDAYHRSGSMKGLFDETVAKGYKLIQPAALWTSLPIDECSGALVKFKHSTFLIPSVKVVKLLSSCSLATLMAATIGREISVETERLMADKRMTEAMIMDAFGSEAVEEAVNALCRMLKKDGVRCGLVMTRRFSPGYGGWPLSEQAEIIDELDGGRIGISVNRSSILAPEKSITAIAGWKPLK